MASVPIPQYLLDACGGDREQALRITQALRPITFKLRASAQAEDVLRRRLAATEAALNRSLSALAEVQDGVTLRSLLAATGRDIQRDMERYTTEGVPGG